MLQAARVPEDTIKLTDQNPKWILGQDSRGRDITCMPAINVYAHPWAVMLNDCVYVKSTGTDSRSGEEIWQYSIKENTWSKHSRPGLFGFKDYTLTVYHSHLMCIGGFVRCEDIEEHRVNKSVFACYGREWKCDDVQPIPEDEKLPSSNELSASSDDTRLYLAWQKDDKAQILQYSRRRKWERKEGPDCESSGSRIEISVINNLKSIFLTEHNDGAQTVICKASLSSYLSSGVPGRSIWTKIQWATSLRDIRPCSFFSNLIVSGGNIMLLAPIPLPRSRSTAVLFNLNINLTSDHVYWDVVGYLQIYWKPDSHPSIFGLRNKTLLVMGGTGDPVTTNTKVCVFKR